MDAVVIRVKNAERSADSLRDGDSHASPRSSRYDDEAEGPAHPALGTDDFDVQAATEREAATSLSRGFGQQAHRDEGESVMSAADVVMVDMMEPRVLVPTDGPARPARTRSGLDQ
jgi:hypothetical protein